MAQLREFHALAKSIVKNSKGEVLLTALAARLCRRGEGAEDQGRCGAAAEGADFHRVPPDPGILYRILETDRVRGQGRALQRHQHRPEIEGDLPARGWSNTPAPTASPVRRPPTCARRSSSTSATKRPS